MVKLTEKGSYGLIEWTEQARELFRQDSAIIGTLCRALVHAYEHGEEIPTVEILAAVEEVRYRSEKLHIEEMDRYLLHDDD